MGRPVRIVVMAHVAAIIAFAAALLVAFDAPAAGAGADGAPQVRITAAQADTCDMPAGGCALAGLEMPLTALVSEPVVLAAPATTALGARSALPPAADATLTTTSPPPRLASA